MQVFQQKNYEINFGSLCLRFEWASDWYVETIQCGSHLLVRGPTVIGVGNWPLTPPLQQLHSELDRDSDLVFGLGAAGDAHWSVSYERVSCANLLGVNHPLAVSGKTGGCLRVQVAARVQRQPDWLGSSYRFHSELKINPCNRGLTGCDPQLPNSGFAVCALENTCSVEFDPMERRIEIRPDNKPARFPNTIQWIYAIVSQSLTAV